jgi:hypothetical protein
MEGTEGRKAYMKKRKDGMKDYMKERKDCMNEGKGRKEGKAIRRI